VGFLLQGIWGKPGRHKNVLVSNLGLTVFVKHLVKLIKQVPQSVLRKKKKKKTMKRQRS
jgi:hypothetical protein